MLEETPEEREVFSAMEQSSVRKETIRQMDKYQSIMEELALARMLIRELGDRLAKLEKPWVGLTDDDWDNIFGNSMTIGETIKLTEAKLKEKHERISP